MGWNIGREALKLRFHLRNFHWLISRPHQEWKELMWVVWVVTDIGMWVNFNAEIWAIPSFHQEFHFCDFGIPTWFLWEKCGPKTATTQQHHCILPQGALNFCSFSPTDVKAITAARDGTVKVWEFEEGIEGGELELRTESGNAPNKRSLKNGRWPYSTPENEHGGPQNDGFGKGGTPALNMEIFGMLSLWGVNVSGQIGGGGTLIEEVYHIYIHICKLICIYIYT